MGRGLKRGQSEITNDCRDILARLPARIRRALRQLPEIPDWEEIRMRAGRPLGIGVDGRFLPVGEDGAVGISPAAALVVKSDDLLGAVNLMTDGSAYASEEDVSRGFLTLPGGHRVGITGSAVLEEGRVLRLLRPAALNIRRGREIRGAAAALVPALRHRNRWCSTLIISPPGCGKTTLLRDLVRVMSDGIPGSGVPGVRVGLVDERSEVAAPHDGVPTFDVGMQTDVMDGCPKGEGMLMLIRSMGPQVIATDELGRRGDAQAVREAVRAGVVLLATVHGVGVSDVSARPHVGEVLSSDAFARAVMLSRRRGPGTVEEVKRLC